MDSPNRHRIRGDLVLLAREELGKNRGAILLGDLHLEPQRMEQIVIFSEFLHYPGPSLDGEQSCAGISTVVLAQYPTRPKVLPRQLSAPVCVLANV